MISAPAHCLTSLKMANRGKPAVRRITNAAWWEYNPGVEPSY